MTQLQWSCFTSNFELEFSIWIKGVRSNLMQTKQKNCHALPGIKPLANFPLNLHLTFLSFNFWRISIMSWVNNLFHLEVALAILSPARLFVFLRLCSVSWSCSVGLIIPFCVVIISEFLLIPYLLAVEWGSVFPLTLVSVWSHGMPQNHSLVLTRYLQCICCWATQCTSSCPGWLLISVCVCLSYTGVPHSNRGRAEWNGSPSRCQSPSHSCKSMWCL